MKTNIEIRPTEKSDWDAIDQINLDAFAGPVEARLVRDLREERAVLVELVAILDGQVAGHIMLSQSAVERSGKAEIPTALLGPISVTPCHQLQGIGGQLIEASADRVRAMGSQLLVLVGHPSYYPRFGFSGQLAQGIDAPWSGKSAFMALDLTDGELGEINGKLRFPHSFDGL